MTLCIGCSIAADAQSSFTQRLQQSKSGEGKITVTQDKAIDELVNGPQTVAAPAKPKTNTNTQPKQTEKKEKDKDNNTATNQDKKTEQPKVVVAEHNDSTATDAPEEIQKKVMKGVKMAGSQACPYTYIFIHHDGFAAWATIVHTRRPTLCCSA